MDEDQINLSIKQLKLAYQSSVSDIGESSKKGKDSAADGSSSESYDDGNDEKENFTPNCNDSHMSVKESKGHGDDGDDGQSSNMHTGTAKERTLYVNILVELLRLHVEDIEKSSSSEKESNDLANDINRKPDDDGDDRHISSSSNSNNNGHTDPARLVTHLSHSIEHVFQEAMVADVDSLEAENVVLKPYLSRLQRFKAVLSEQLNEIKENETFSRFGLSKGCTDKDIKRAYHKIAISCHPDKGGSKQEFQALHDR